MTPYQVLWLVLSGQVEQYKDGSIPEDPIEQIKAALENISYNLHTTNMKVSDVVNSPSIWWENLKQITTERF